MARRKVGEGAATPNGGAISTEARNAEIAAIQNEAIARTKALADVGSPMDTNGGGGDGSEPVVPDDDPEERAAIQAEARPSAAIAKDVTSGALGAGFFGRPAATSAPTAPLATAIVSAANKAFATDPGGSEVTYTSGEEMYGKQGSFSSYRVGPVTIRDRCREGETIVQAIARLRADAAAIMAEERVSKDREFKAHFKAAFG